MTTTRFFASGVWSRAVVILALFTAWVVPGGASAHESTPALLALKEVAEGRFVARWTPSFPEITDLVVHLPPPCLLDGDATFGSGNAPIVPAVLDCGTGELTGEIRFTSQRATLGPIGVSVEWRDGTQVMRLSAGAPATVTLGGTASTGTWQIFSDYVRLGLEHILVGVDHLLFLLGLLLLVRGWRALLATISAFTLAHSVTLAAASLQVVEIPVAPVEICIALSVLLLAFEAANDKQTLTRRKPWLVAFGFGLLHGLGFASALSDVGLPKHALATSLLGFNLGVELGQLLVVGVVFGGYRLLRRRPLLVRRLEFTAVGLLASCSVYWLLDRVQGWLTGFGT